MSADKVDINSLVLSNDDKPEKVQAIYDRFAVSYDEEVTHDVYPALKVTIDTFIKSVGEADKNIKIIDLGAGTGHAGLELKKHGFDNVDGLDLSPEMLKKAKEKNAYKKYICAAVTEKRLDIATGAYDAVICAGSMTSGYIKAEAFDEILRLVKPGGVIVFTLRKDTLELGEYGYAEKFDKLTKEGKWVETGKFLSDYVIGFDDILKKCYVLSYKVLKNQ